MSSSKNSLQRLMILGPVEGKRTQDRTRGQNGLVASKKAIGGSMYRAVRTAKDRMAWRETSRMWSRSSAVMEVTKNYFNSALTRKTPSIQDN